MQGEFVALAGDLARLLQEMRDITGLNEVTDGSTPSDRMLNGVASMAMQATNNALYPMLYAEKTLLEKLAKGVIQRLQIAVKNGDVEGIAKALGTGTVKFIKVTDAIAPVVFGIMIEDRPTDEQKQMLMQQLATKDAQGQVDPDVYIKVMNTRNLKQAEMQLAYSVKKKQERDQQRALQLQQANTQTQIQSAQAAEEEKRKTMQMEHEFRMEQIKLEKEMEMQIKLAELQVKAQGNQLAHDAKVGTTIIQADQSDAEHRRDLGQNVDDDVQLLDDLPQEEEVIPAQTGIPEGTPMQSLQ
jgi:hypothetical protein